MKIKITTERQPWIGGKPQPLGAELEVAEDNGKQLVELGFAEIVEAPKPVRRGKVDA